MELLIGVVGMVALGAVYVGLGLADGGGGAGCGGCSGAGDGKECAPRTAACPRSRSDRSGERGGTIRTRRRRSTGGRER